MSKLRRGQRTFWTASILAVAVISGAGWAQRDAIYERWLLWELDSRDDETRFAAADTLADRKSLRAIPKLVDLIIDDEREVYVRYTVRDSGLIPLGVSHTTGKPGMTPLLHALYRIGSDAERLVQDALERRRSGANETLERRVAFVEATYANIRKDDPEMTGRLARMTYDEIRGAFRPKKIR